MQRRRIRRRRRRKREEREREIERNDNRVTTGMTTQSNRIAEIAYSLKKHCTWCKGEFGPNRGKSRAHVVGKSLASRVTTPFQHVTCNERLGQNTALLEQDYFIKRGKQACAAQGMECWKLDTQQVYDGRLERISELVLQDGRTKPVLPDTPQETYRAVAVIMFNAAPLVIGSRIFDTCFDHLREFIERGEPDLVEKGERGIHRSFPNNNWRPKHAILFQCLPPQRVTISVSFFNNYEFGTVIKLDRDIEPFEVHAIIEKIGPEKGIGLYKWDRELKAFKFVRSLEGFHFT
jgi:hypothetical protein